MWPTDGVASRFVDNRFFGISRLFEPKDTAPQRLFSNLRRILLNYRPPTSVSGNYPNFSPLSFFPSFSLSSSSSSIPSIPVFLRVSPPVRRRKIHVDPVMYANEFGPDKTRVGKSRQASFSVSNGHSVRAPASKSSVFPHFTYFQQEKDRRSVKQTT